LPFIALIIYFKKYDYSFKGFISVIIITVLTFVIIYYGVILGLPDFISKFNNLYIILFVVLIPTLTLIFLFIKDLKINFTFSSRFLSILSILIISLLVFNKLFIKSIDDISYTYDNEIRIIDDSLYYHMAENSYENLNYEYIESLKKDRAKVIKQQQIFNKKKNKLGFFKLLFWQSKFVILGTLFIFIGIPIFGFYIFFNKKNDYSFQLKIFFSCFILILIGYSSYITIFIRAGQHPRINENNPDDLKSALAYINRDQYGAITSFNPASAIQSSSGGHWKRWTLDKNNPTFFEQINFVWNYQIKEMYLRYFAWQFIGRSDKEDKPWLMNDINNQPVGNRKLDGVNFFRYGLPLAFIFGMLGFFFHFSRDWEKALAVLSVFLAMGLMLVLYLNQYDPQPRERDYSYVGSFFAFSIWIGLGICFVQQKIKEFVEDSNISSFISITIAIFIFILMPLRMFASDYKEHSRKDNYVAWDYGYNLLNSCEPNSIIFTNGDNDTFPLWYLQEVENIRQDVKVVNLSLLNTPWYIEQLMQEYPKLDINFTNELLRNDIHKIESDYLISTTEGYRLCSKEFTGEIPWDYLDCELVLDNKITFSFNVPAYRQQVLRIQDYMILQLIKDLYFEKPIYFAATVSDNNQVGLGKYLQMEGMTYRLVSEVQTQTDGLNYNKMKLNLTQSNLSDTIKNKDDYNNALLNNKGIYRYKNLNNEEIIYSDNIKRLVQNYRIGYLRMMQYQLNDNNLKEVELLVNQMDEYFPTNILPMDPWLGFEMIDKIYTPLNAQENQKNMINHLIQSNSDINVKLIAILRSLELGYYQLTEELIEKHIVSIKVPIESKLALLFEVINNVGYHSSLNSLINEIVSNDIDELSLNDKYTLFGIFYQIKNNDATIKFGKSLLINHYTSDLSDINTQKYIADILFEVMEINNFIDFCNQTFKKDKIEGMLYTLINAYQFKGDFELAIQELDRWLIDNPLNKRMKNKKQKVIENQSIQ